MTGPSSRSRRPTRVIAVTGTDTDIGKTWVTCELLRHARNRGAVVAARKPVQSFETLPHDLPEIAGDADRLVHRHIDGGSQRQSGDATTDAHLLANASGEDPHQVCPPHRWYEVAMAPPMAADALSLPLLTANELLAELTWPPAIDLGIVETVGGVRSPLAHDADSATLTSLIEPDSTVLVADAGLGTINAVRLAVAVLEPGHVIVFLNRYDPRDDLHRRNRQWLSDRDGLHVVVDVTELHDAVTPGPARRATAADRTP